MPRRGRRPRTPRERSIAHTMRKFKHKTLRSGKPGPGKGPVVRSRRQAIAIALSVAGKKYGPYISKGRRSFNNKEQSRRKG